PGERSARAGRRRPGVGRASPLARAGAPRRAGKDIRPLRPRRHRGAHGPLLHRSRRAVLPAAVPEAAALIAFCLAALLAGSARAAPVEISVSTTTAELAKPVALEARAPGAKLELDLARSTTDSFAI